jgi:hypothetical protein
MDDIEVELMESETGDLLPIASVDRKARDELRSSYDPKASLSLILGFDIDQGLKGNAIGDEAVPYAVESDTDESSCESLNHETTTSSQQAKIDAILEYADFITKSQERKYLAQAKVSGGQLKPSSDVFDAENHQPSYFIDDEILSKDLDEILDENQSERVKKLIETRTNSLQSGCTCIGFFRQDSDLKTGPQDCDDDDELPTILQPHIDIEKIDGGKLIGHSLDNENEKQYGPLPRRVRFCHDLVSAVYLKDPYTEEDKCHLFYTTKEMQLFRLDYLCEMQEQHVQARMTRAGICGTFKGIIFGLLDSTAAMCGQSPHA